MRLESSGRAIHNAAAAALFGAAVGAAAGVFSLRGATVPAAAETSPPAAISTAEPPPPASPAPSPALQPQPAATDSTPIATKGVVTHPAHDPPPAKPAEPKRPSADLPADSPAAVLARARSLADRHDVLGLMALHDAVARAAQQRGDADSAGVKSLLEQVDQRLNEARMWRLKSDAEQFRKAAAAK